MESMKCLVKVEQPINLEMEGVHIVRVSPKVTAIVISSTVINTPEKENEVKEAVNQAVQNYLSSEEDPD